MAKLMIFCVLAVSVLRTYGLQVQMPEAAELHDDEQDLQSQIKELQKNMTDIWTYIYDLKNAVSGHLKHLRVHQMELESSVHRMEHLHEGVVDSSSHDSPHSDSHHHSDDHSHCGDPSHHDDHIHGSDHSHSEDHSHSHDEHSHSDDHSHGSDHQPHSDDHSDHQSHSNDHSHGSHHDHHSHGDDHSHDEHGSDHHGHHSHDGDHGHHTHSESHSSHDHSKDDHSSDHQQHKDSHETEDFSQHTQKVGSDPRPVAEPVVVATNVNRQDGHGHHGHHTHMRNHHSSRTNEMDLMDNFNHHHHEDYHHGQHTTTKKNKTMKLPTSADYNLYDFATCSIQPNRAIPKDEQQNVGGYVNFWQKKSGGPLNIHVKVQGFEMGGHHGSHGELQKVGQQVQSLNQYGQDSEDHSSEHSEHVNSPPKSHKHGFTVHERGDLRNGCENTGLHYNPKNAYHGGLMERHVGDLGNIECDEHGVANLLFSDDVASLGGLYSIVGKSLVIHADEDDLGKGDNLVSLITGNSGTKIACCLIQKVDKLQLRHYKAMKTAKHYNNH